MKRAAAVLVLLLSIAVAASGQQVPGRERGFKPEQAYQFNGLDSINLFSGNPNLTVPLSATYPVANGLSYSFALRYSGNVWHYIDWEGSLHDTEHERWFLLRGNAGLGWTMSFGGLEPPAPGLAPATTLASMWRYMSPDGGVHAFYPTLHEPQCSAAITSNCEDVVAGFSYTRDNTYLRLKNGVGANDHIVELGDGQRQLYRCDQNGGNCRLAYIYNVYSEPDASGTPTKNYVHFDYDTPDYWIITDTIGRMHRVHLQASPSPSNGQIVDWIDLETAGGVRTTINFTYDNFTGGDTDDPNVSQIVRPCEVTRLAPARFLTRVDLPDNAHGRESYRFDYYHPSDLATPCPQRDQSGTLTEATLPTGGRLTWSYQSFDVTGSYASIGVKDRIAYDANGRKLQHTAYHAGDGTVVETLAPGANENDPWHVSYKTHNYFWYGTGRDFGLPTTSAAVSGVPNPDLPNEPLRSRYLSTVTYDCSVSADCSVPARATYLKHEMDYVKEGFPDCTFDLPCYQDRNRRVVSESTLFFASGKIADTEYSAFDGLGHYRNADVGDYYTTLAGRQSKRETYTSFNPSAGVYAVDQSLQRVGSYSGFSPAAPWILGTYDFTRTKEGNRYAVTEACFEPATGYMLRARALGVGVRPNQPEVPPQPSVFRTNADLVSVFEKDDVTFTGWDKTQKFYGGDSQPSIGTGDLCNATLPSTSQYQLDYTYENGGLKTMRYAGTPTAFYSVDQTIDKSTGLALQSRDTAGLLTSFTYDKSGRPLTITPPGGAAPTTYDYVPASGTSPAHITVVTGSASAENRLEQQYEFDGLGRLAHEKRLMPGGALSTRETLYDFAGRRASVSEWGNLAAKTTFAGYDAFGRVGTITAADGASTGFTYEGVWRTTRTVDVATSTTGSTPVSVVEESDRLGRLVSVTEGVTSSSPAGQKTDYTYRIGDQLASVLMQDGGTSSQTRTFTYDGRNLLLSEQHPESGTTAYQYDARGHVVTKTTPTWQLTLDYDGAERVKSVSAAPIDNLTARKTLKTYEYDTAPNLGRLVAQTRSNYVGSGQYDVADAFAYDAAGRVSSKTTTITHANEPATTFTQAYEYTDLGQSSILHFPTCSSCGTADIPVRTIPLAYKGGLLTGIGNLTFGNGITYTPAGQVYQVQHAALNGGTPAQGVLDTYQPDSSGIPRPGRITFTGANDCNLILGQSTLNVPVDQGGTATFSVTAAPNTTFAWYEGARGDTSTPLAGMTQDTLVTPALDDSKNYWCRVTASGSCSKDSPTFTATVCKPARIAWPGEFSGDAEVLKTGKSLVMDVAATGTTVNYTWQRGNMIFVNNTWQLDGDLGNTIGTSHDYTFTADTNDAGHTYGFFMTVSGQCGISTPRRLIRVVTVKSAVQCAAPTIFTSFPPELFSWPTMPVTLSVSVEDENGAGLESNEHLSYRWVVNGQILPSQAPTYTTYAHTPELVTMEVARLCNDGTRSPSVKRSTFIYDGRHCPLPMFTLDRTAVVFDLQHPEHNTITVTSPWPSVTFEWIRGDRNNGQVIGTGREFTPQFPVGTLFVRATSPCGTVADSALITVSSGGCQPVQFTRPPQSADVKAKTRTVLTYETNSDPVSTIWYEGVAPNHHEVARTHDLVLDPPQPLKTTKYWVQVDGNCSFAQSPVATLHVTSCDDITVAQQPQSASINAGQTAQLQIIASSQFTLSYQWYLGESGDDSHPIAGQTLPTYLAQPTVTASYWVRSSIAGGCEIDSPTVTVHVCRAPVISQTSIEYTSLFPNYWHRLNAVAAGDDLTYQWYIGEVGDTSTPLGTTESTVIVTPLETTKYWFRATSDCFGTTPDAHADSAQVRVSVCPAITAQPALQYPEVMAGATATITIAADRGDVIEWHRRNADGSSSGVLGTGAVFHPVVNAASTFYAVVKSGTCTVDSEPVTVGICSKPTIDWAAGMKTKIATGEAQVLSVISSSSGVYEPSLTWYIGNRGDVAGSTVVNGPGMGIVQHSIAPSVTTSYWVRITETSGCYADTPALTVEVCVPTIRTQPSSTLLDKITNPSATATLSVTADGGALTYQWYLGQPGDVTDSLAGQTSSSLTVSPSADTTYWVRVTGSCGVSKDSAAATVTLCKAPQITAQPQNITAAANASTTLTVTATGTELTYQWYAGASGVTTTPLGTSASQTVSPGTTSDYWVRVSGRCGASVNSSTAKVSVAPAITAQPAGGSVMPGTSRTLSVTASGTQLSYQWYSGASTLINGATSAAFTTPPINANTTYWVRVFSGNASVDSDPAALSVCTQPTIAWNATQTQITYGQSQTLSVSATVADPANEKSYTWYSGTDSGVVAGATVVSSGPLAVQYTTPGLTATTKYWVRIGEGTVCYADTPTLTVQVCVPTITAHPQAAMINSGANATLSVTANGGALTYQWYIGASGDTSNPISGQTSASLTVSPAVDTTYWVRVSGSCGQTRNSNAATVTVCKTPQITSHPQNVTLAQAGSATLGVTATGTNLTYQWYAGTSPNTSTPVGGTSAAFTVQVNATSDYWVRVSGSCGSPANSNTAKVSVPPSITTQPAGAAVTKGTTRTLTVAASGNQLAYQWYYGATAVSGATAASFTTPAINADVSYFARVYSGNAYTDSATATLTVCQPRSVVIVSNPGTSGSSVTLRTDTSDGSETYEWYRGESGVTTTLVGTGAQITMSNVTATGRYWVRTKRATCDADSAAVTVSICIPAISTQPQSATITSGSTKTLTVAANGTAPLTYQWYIGASGTTTNPVSGATSATFTTPALTTTTTYWCQVKSPVDAACSTTAVNSAAATVTVCQQPAITQNPQNATLPFNTSSVTLTVTATGNGLSYQWYEGTAGVTTTPVGSNSSSLTRTPGTTKSYWVRVTGTCGTADSTAALVSVTPSIVSQPSHQTVCQNSTQTFTVGATGSPLNYQWYKSTGGSWQAVGSDSPSLTLVITVQTDVMCTVRSGNATKDTFPATISITPAPVIYSGISKQAMGNSWYKLSVSLDTSDVTYAWYRGALGNTSQPLAGNDPEPLIQATTSTPVWVRVTSNETGCFSDASTVVP